MGTQRYRVIDKGEKVFEGNAEEVGKLLNLSKRTVYLYATHENWPHIQKVARVEVNPAIIHYYRRAGKVAVGTIADAWGMTYQSAQQRLAGHSDLTEEQVDTLAEVLGVEVDELLEESDWRMDLVRFDHEKAQAIRKEQRYTYKDISQVLGIGAMSTERKFNGKYKVRDYEAKLLEDLFFLEEGELIK